MDMVDDVDALRLSLAELAAERDSLVQAHQEELARVKAAARDTVLAGALRAEAARLGAYDPDLVAAHVDRSAITWSEEGAPQGVEKALRDAREVRRFLFRETGQRLSGEAQESAGIVPKPAPAQGQDARQLPAHDYALRKRQFLAGII
ncbi:hypothetical protein AA0311_0992 [Asaia bogorensis NBRC 16594]|uniref:Phage minor structual protein GP20 n=2 Tax=Asaia bogorensis TaxID=91915 RepID=A0AAN4R3S2_9PROT|nr:hypothetical protein AA0311_0992 [Asaia bogorensis NBRC 16594]GEL53807.1 hypothetical protein ABO01nite_18140 [Asaia bogorensis NBRC 16594]